MFACSFDARTKSLRFADRGGKILPRGRIEPCVVSYPRDFMTVDAPFLHRTSLYDLHVSLGARIVPFAGYEMPVQYPSGIKAEHLWTRAHAGLFDVSHMGQATLIGHDHTT